MNSNEPQRRIDNPNHSAARTKILMDFFNRILGAVGGRDNLHRQNRRSLHRGALNVDSPEVIAADKSHVRIADRIRTKPEIDLNHDLTEIAGFNEFAQTARDPIANAVVLNSRRWRHHESSFVQLIQTPFLFREILELAECQSGCGRIHKYNPRSSA